MRKLLLIPVPDDGPIKFHSGTTFAELISNVTIDKTSQFGARVSKEYDLNYPEKANKTVGGQKNEN